MPPGPGRDAGAADGLLLLLFPSQERNTGPRESKVKPSTAIQVAIQFRGGEEPGYSLRPEELCCSLPSPALADASRGLWQSPAATCPVQTHLTARSRDPCGNKRDAAISGGGGQAHLAETFNIYQMKTSCLLHIYPGRCSRRWAFHREQRLHLPRWILAYRRRPRLLTLQRLTLLEFLSTVT